MSDFNGLPSDIQVEAWRRKQLGLQNPYLLGPGSNIPRIPTGLPTEVNTLLTLDEFTLLPKLLEDTQKSGFGEFFKNNALTLGSITDFVGQLLPKSEYAGTHGDLTLSLDSAFGSLSDKIMAVNPIAGFAMKAGDLTGKTLSKKIGTDGMTTTDAILGSSFLNLTPLGLINGIGAKRTSGYTRDDKLFEQLGPSYAGADLLSLQASTVLKKRFGLFSNNEFKNAQKSINEANTLKTTMENIYKTAQDNFAIVDSMASIANNKRELDLQNRFSPLPIGRNGVKLLSPNAFTKYLLSLPINQRDSVNFRVRDYWEFNGRPRDFNLAILKGMFVKESDGWHANSVARNPDTGEIEFMKASSHPSHHMEIDWYNSDEAAEFRDLYELQRTEPYWKYVKRKPVDEISSFQIGGSFEESPKMYVLEEVTLDSILPEFREGGKVNVIPEGALHARLHHMENAENLTKKGIPVVSEKDGGELEQLAEIEREEIIFRLEVTKKLEELSKKYSDDESSLSDKDAVAIEAGKLLVEEILNNTIDNTGLLTNIN